MRHALEWTNVGLFALASLAAFGSLNKMRAGETRPCMIGAVLLIALGCAAQAMGELFEQWAHIADTLVAGGVLGMLIASQRTHTWFLERWANPVASVIATAVGVIFVGWLLSGCAAPPQAVCEPPELHVVMTPAGPLYLLDQAGVETLAAQLRALDAGTCRLPAEAKADGT